MTGQPGPGVSEEKRPPVKRPARVFISYAQEDAELRAELDKHLTGLRKSGHVLVWHDWMVQPGDPRTDVVDAELEAADIVLVLVSANFFASSSCFDIELAKALERHERGQARVIPVLVRDCDWTDAPFSHLRAMPYEPGAGAKPITAWSDRDAAWASVARELRSLLDKGGPDPTPKPRSYSFVGFSAVGLATVGIAVLAGVYGTKEGPSQSATPPAPVETAGPSSAPVAPPASAASLPPTASDLKQPPALPALAAPTLAATASAAPVAGTAPKRGTATLSGAFWTLGVPRAELGGAAFVCLDPAPRPSELAGVQPTCSLLAGSGVAQCSRSDKARNVPLGASVSWRLPCP